MPLPRSSESVKQSLLIVINLHHWIYIHTTGTILNQPMPFCSAPCQKPSSLLFLYANSYLSLLYSMFVKNTVASCDGGSFFSFLSVCMHPWHSKWLQCLVWERCMRVSLSALSMYGWWWLFKNISKVRICLEVGECQPSCSNAMEYTSLFLNFFHQLVFHAATSGIWDTVHRPCISTFFCRKRFYSTYI